VSISQPVSNSYTLAIQGETLIRNHSLGTSKQAKELYTRKEAMVECYVWFVAHCAHSNSLSSHWGMNLVALSPWHTCMQLEACQSKH